MARKIIAMFSVAVMLTVLGCQDRSGWEISVENKSKEPCSVLVTMGNDKHRTAKVDKLASSKPTILIGEKPDNILRSIKVTHASWEQELEVDANLTSGKIYEIIIGDDGRIQGKLRDK